MKEGSTEASFEDILIFFVKQHPQLYDPSHESYEDLEKKLKLWEEIAQELDEELRWCILTWISLMLHYIVLSLLRLGDEWPNYNSMKFMDEHLGIPSALTRVNDVGRFGWTGSTEQLSSHLSLWSVSSFSYVALDNNCFENMNEASTQTSFEDFLVLFVKQHPELYDAGLESYWDMEKNLKAWKEIAHQLGEKTQWCNLKWATLLLHYIALRILGSEDEWAYGSAMQFMDKHLKGLSSPPIPDLDSSPGDEAGTGSGWSRLTEQRSSDSSSSNSTSGSYIIS